MFGFSSSHSLRPLRSFINSTNIVEIGTAIKTPKIPPKRPNIAIKNKVIMGSTLRKRLLTYGAIKFWIYCRPKHTHNKIII